MKFRAWMASLAAPLQSNEDVYELAQRLAQLARDLGDEASQPDAFLAREASCRPGDNHLAHPAITHWPGHEAYVVRDTETSPRYHATRTL